ncbi:MAG: exopolysaccharide Pel transporter PelG [Dehalococcoidales bacterium]|nr:exopolysaccharide Pel transporter PelG [Dehalococcoidales bacterium]
MSGVGFDMKDVNKTQPRYPAVSRAILFIIPSIVITVISIILFSQLTGLSEAQMNVFSITIISAIVLSLIGMAGMQVLIYRIIDDRDFFKDGATTRATAIGFVGSLLFSLIISASLYPFFSGVLGFSLTEYVIFSTLLLMYSAIWVFASAFWASEEYTYPAIIFSISYLAILGFTLFAYNTDHIYTILGYSLGTAILFILLLLVSAILFPKPETNHKFTGDFSKVFSLASHSGDVIFFSIFYVIAIFLDKIIVWVYQGLASGQGLLVTGTYGVGSFLGLIPMFSIAIMVYFTNRTKPLNDERYDGTFSEIQKRVLDYKSVYWSSIGTMLVVALALFALIASLSFYYFSDEAIMRVLVTVSIGSIFFSVIVFNSAVLPIFGKTSISTLAVFFVIIFEILTIPFVAYDVWYASLGFLLGSFIGFLISMISTMRLFYHFEHNMFRYLLHSN